MPTENTHNQPFVDSFDPARPGLPGAELEWLKAFREAGIERFESLGLPTTKLETWKYTRLRPLEDTRYQPVTDEDAMAVLDSVPSLLPDPGGRPRLVFVNGQMRPNFWIEGDLPEGVTLECLRDALENQPDLMRERLGADGGEDAPSLVQLNAAMMDTGFVLRVEEGVRVETPIEVIFVGGLTDRPVAYSPRNLIVLGKGAEATVVKYHAGLGVGAYFANSVTEIDVGPGAVLRNYKIQAEAKEATHIGTVRARVARDATYESFSLSIGGRLSRNEVSVRLEGEDGHAAVNGAYLMRGNEHCDNTTQIDHLVPHTTSREVFKGVLDDESKAVFQGRIVVHKDAQKTDGHQLCKTLLLSTGAEIDAKPELEIYADDVKCSHGATVGDLDREALFYLQARGIDPAGARALLIEGFIAELLDDVDQPAVAAQLRAMFADWQGARGRAAEAA